MQTVLIVIHLLIVLALIGVVLLQRSEGGLGLGGGGSGGGGGVGGFMTGRGQANALTRATAILATAFFTTSLILGIMAHRGAAPKSIIDGASSSAPATGTPAAEGEAPIQLGTPPAAPAAPASPAAPTTPVVPQSR